MSIATTPAARNALKILAYLADNGMASSHLMLATACTLTEDQVDDALVYLGARDLADYFVGMVGEYASITITDAGREFLTAAS